MELRKRSLSLHKRTAKRCCCRQPDTVLGDRKEVDKGSNHKPNVNPRDREKGLVIPKLRADFSAPRARGPDCLSQPLTDTKLSALEGELLKGFEDVEKQVRALEALCRSQDALIHKLQAEVRTKRCTHSCSDPASNHCHQAWIMKKDKARLEAKPSSVQLKFSPAPLRMLTTPSVPAMPAMPALSTMSSMSAMLLERPWQLPKTLASFPMIVDVQEARKAPQTGLLISCSTLKTGEVPVVGGDLVQSAAFIKSGSSCSGASHCGCFWPFPPRTFRPLSSSPSASSNSSSSSAVSSLTHSTSCSHQTTSPLSLTNYAHFVADRVTSCDDVGRVWKVEARHRPLWKAVCRRRDGAVLSPGTSVIALPDCSPSTPPASSLLKRCQGRSASSLATHSTTTQTFARTAFPSFALAVKKPAPLPVAAVSKEKVRKMTPESGHSEPSPAASTSVSVPLRVAVIERFATVASETASPCAAPTASKSSRTAEAQGPKLDARVQDSKMARSKLCDSKAVKNSKAKAKLAPPPVRAAPAAQDEGLDDWELVFSSDAAF